MLDPARIKELFEYRDGHLFWRDREDASFESPRAATVWRTRFVGKMAGSLHRVRSGDRWRVTITDNGITSRYYASRVIWAWHHGVWPCDLVDHIDGDTLNNRIENLRDVSAGENSRNLRLHPRNSSGQPGVRKGNGGKWRAEIMSGGETRRLGTFSRREDAIAARQAAERELGFHPNHGRPVHV